MLYGVAYQQPDGTPIATSVEIDGWVPHGAEVVAVGSGYIDVHVQTDKMHLTVLPERKRLMLAAQTVTQVLVLSTRKTFGSLSHVRPGQYITFDDAEADDGNFVVFDLYLGASNVAPPTPSG